MIKTYLYNSQENKVYHDVDLEQKDSLLQDPSNLLWIDVYECSSKELDYIGKLFDFHPLAIEDVLQDSPRAKVDRYENGYYFFVFHALRYNEEADDEITTSELDVFLGSNYIVSIHRKALPNVGRAAYECLRGPKLMQRGPDYLLYSIVDGIIDEYFPILERLGVRIDELEDELYTNPAKEITDEILALKRSLLLLRKVITPQKRIFANVNGRYSFEIREENRPYYLDLVDNVERITDTIDTYRDLVSSAFDTYFSIISNRTNDIIRVLTIISTITMPLTFVTGLFGMNVEFPFTTDDSWAFWIILTGMIGMITAMLFAFKHKKWL